MERRGGVPSASQLELLVMMMQKKVLVSSLMVAALMVASACSPAAPKTASVERPVPVASSVKAAPAEAGDPYLFADMDAKVSEILDDGTEYAVYLAYPQKSSSPYIYNSQSMRSASMIKVFILAAVMEKANNGELSIDEGIVLKSSDKVGGAGILAGYASGTELSLREIMRLMITESDNTATNMVIDRIGMSAINDYIARNGYSDTILQRKMMDFDAVNAGLENYSSVRDLGTIFLKLYQHNCVSWDYDEIMLDFLKGQTDTDCFPAALPGKVIAHKTGALVGLYDDGGIIYNEGNDTILVIMTENYSGEYTTIEHMKAFARAVVD